MFFSATVPVHVNHLHPVQSLFFYFTWQQFLQYIYSQHAASTVFYAYSTSYASLLQYLSTWRLRDVCVTSTVRPSVPLPSTTSAARHWPIMVETSARLHFTHQTETSTFVYIYISRTFSWLLQQNWQCSELPDPSSFSIQAFFSGLYSFYNVSTRNILWTFSRTLQLSKQTFFRQPVTPFQI